MHVRAGFSQFLDSRLSLSPTFVIGELAGMTREKLEGMNLLEACFCREKSNEERQPPTLALPLKGGGKDGFPITNVGNDSRETSGMTVENCREVSGSIRCCPTFVGRHLMAYSDEKRRVRASWNPPQVSGFRVI